MANKLDKQNVMDLDDTNQEKIIQQYELIRQSGLTNMFNYTNVKYIAKKIECTELYNFVQNSVHNYQTILRNFGKLMKKFDIKQD